MSSVECFECWTVHSYEGDYNPMHDHGVKHNLVYLVFYI